MFKKWLSGLLTAAMVMTSIPAMASAEETALIPAFPGAEGAAKYTTGGRGGEVYEVTTLADSGPGSLRDAVSGSGRTIVFKVGGTIHLQSPLKITGSNLTIAGQTAPGEGITVADYTTSIEGDNLIIRYLRFRLGDAFASEDDAFGGRYHRDIMIDHCSFSWSVDEVLSLYENENTTVQWSIISESMLMTTHQKGRHGYGGIWGGNKATFHHNLIAHNASRNPRLPGLSPADQMELFNNVIYNWGFFSTYGGEQGTYNLMNNYYKYGPNTYKTVRGTLFADVAATSHIYLGGNIAEGYPDVTADNWKGVLTVADPAAKMISPFAPAIPTQVEPAAEAYDSVLANAGATLPKRDAVDARVVSDVRNRTGNHINSPNQIGGVPEFNSTRSAEPDSDHDGMPDQWETAAGLNPEDAADRNATGADGYTMLERYLNELKGSGSANPSVSLLQPADNAVVTDGSIVRIEAEASDSDGTIAKVEFYDGSRLIGEALTPPYALDWSGASDGSHFVTAKAIDDSGTSTQSDMAAVHVNAEGSIAPWNSQDIGNPGIQGHTQLRGAEGEVTVRSAGDIGGSRDNFHYAYQQLSGNGEVIARVDSVTATDDGAEAGVMVRASLDASSPAVSLMIPYVKMGRKSIMLTRTEAGGSTNAVEPEAFITVPYWVKIVRLGDRFTSLASKDGTVWEVIGAVDIDMPETIYFGLAADASKADDDVDKYNSSTFSKAQVRSVAGDYPTVPANVRASAGSNQITLGWESVADATYKVKRSVVPGGPYETIAEDILETSYVDVGLTAGQTFYYVVTASNASGESFNSSEVSAVPTGAPETVYFVQDDYETVVSGSTPAGYIVTPDPQDADHRLQAAANPSLSAANNSSQSLMMYDNGVGNTQWIRKFAPQKGPLVIEADLYASSWPGTAVALQLQDEAGSKTPLSIEIRKPTQPAAEANYTFVYKKNGADYKLTDAPAGDRWYRIKVTANAATGKADIYIDNALVADDIDLQADMKEVGIGRLLAKTPGTGKGTIYYDNIHVYVEPVQSPSGLQAIPGDGRIGLTWAAADGAASYTVKRSTAADGPFEPVAAELTETSYTDGGLTNGTPYYYVVTASGASGESGDSNIATATPSADAVKPEAPAGLSAAARHTQIDLSWQPVAGAQSYTVKRAAAPEGPFTVLASSLDTTSYRDGGLTDGTDYYYVVSATGLAGEGIDSEPIKASPAAQLAAPIVTAAASNKAVHLQWEPVAGADSYEILRDNGAGGPLDDVHIVTDGAASYEDTSVHAGFVYRYQVRAMGGGMAGLASSVVSVRPNVSDGTPAAPEGLNAEPRDGAVALRWQSSDMAVTYTVRRSSEAEGPFETIASNLAEARYTDEGLTNGKRYYYLVAAVNGSGEGASSRTAAETPARVLTVAKDGSGDFTTIQAAIDAVPAGSESPIVISIRDGVYREKLLLDSSKTNVHLIGESRDGTVLVYGDSAKTLDANGKELGTSGSYSFKVLANGFGAENLTIQNDAGISAGQAVALYASGDRMTFRNVALRGHQDTFYANGGRQYFVDSYIEGTVDFIFGGASVVFERCELHSLGGGYVTAASTPEGSVGYVFLNSRLTSEPGLTGMVALGRPWRPNAHVAYVNSYMGDHIKTVGWDNWGNAANEKTARYEEYGSYGPGSDAVGRYAWSKQLTTSEAASYTPELLLGGADGWNPVDRSAWINSSTALRAITADGMLINGFSTELNTYEIELDPQAATAPVIDANALASSAVVTIQQADSPNGRAEIQVLAADGSKRVVAVQFSSDRIAPTVRLEANPSNIWPANGKMVPIHLSIDAADDGSGIESVVLTSITSSLDDGDGQRNKSDIEGAQIGTNDFDFMLRAAKSGKNGAVYTIVYTVTDRAGNKSTASIRIVVDK
ncbi:hypothetical protein PCCS19_10980 [Paenibacillus sp. CCS19]|uniref:pectinesterase family protein n=1 Tax=Paenibacillus sp. CCS19 TaxID=3158387 RepID=UPI002563230C|nr:pectinesterase family protein [Paenibacillus cellulosilyticus]GMK38044.1 hypothetical protein PCCS19_10980 [Paenibacillus cellulosilyticus]